MLSQREHQRELEKQERTQDLPAVTRNDLYAIAVELGSWSLRRRGVDLQYRRPAADLQYRRLARLVRRAVKAAQKASAACVRGTP